MSKTEYIVDGLDALEKQLSKMIEQEYPQRFCELVYQLAEELRGKVVELTPEGIGDLRDAWKVGKIIKKGNEYYIEVYNNLDYVEHVEYGHRQEVGRYVPAIGKRLKKPFVEGAHMMELSLAELNTRLPAYLKKWLNEFISTNNL